MESVPLRGKNPPLRGYQRLTIPPVRNRALLLSGRILLRDLQRDRTKNGQTTHSYIVELKYSAADAPDSELAAKREQGIRQLREYAADPAVPTLAKDTTLRLVLLQWKFHDMVNCELVEERKM